MKMNNWDVSNAHGQQWKVSFYKGISITNSSKWEKGMTSPALYNGDFGFRSVEIVIRVQGETRQQSLERCSQIIGKCSDIVDIEFDNYTHKFKGKVSSITHSEFDKKQLSHRLTIKVDGYDYTEETTVDCSNTRSVTINNTGTGKTPVMLSITFQSGAVTTNITGFGKQITLKSMSKDDVVTIDGETGLALRNGVPSDKIVMWDLPYIKNGANVITVDNDWLTFTVSYKPRFA